MLDEFFKGLELARAEVIPKHGNPRLYYDSSGLPLFYTMDTVPGDNYIEVTVEQLAQGRYDIRVINGKIVLPNSNKHNKLIPTDEDSTSTTTTNAMVVDPAGTIKWKVRNYED
jgi:hypothetical protein